jgi:hypothetical protein
MKNTSYPTSTLTRPANLIPQILAAVMGGTVIFAMLLAGVVIGFNVYYTGESTQASG